MRITVTLAAVLYTLGTSMAWALDDTPTLAPRFTPRPEEGRTLNRGVPVALTSAALSNAARTAATDSEAATGALRSMPQRPQPLPLTRVLPADSHGGSGKLPAKPL